MERKLLCEYLRLRGCVALNENTQDEDWMLFKAYYVKYNFDGRNFFIGRTESVEVL